MEQTEKKVHPHYRPRKEKGTTLDFRNKSAFLVPGDVWVDQGGPEVQGGRGWEREEDRGGASMSWKWVEKSHKDIKGLPSSTYLVCKGATDRIRYEAISGTTIFQFAELMRSQTEPKVEADSPKRKGKTKITVTELGRAIELPENYVPFRSYDPDDLIQKALVRQMELSFDRCSGGALKTSALKVTTSTATLKMLIPGAKWSDTEAVCGVASGYMASRVKPYTNNSYIGIGGVRFLRGVKRHPRLLPWRKYLNEGDVLFKDEIGAIGPIRWIECNDTAILRDEAVVFGHRGLLVQEVRTPELRIYNQIIAWYGILGFGGQNVLHIPERRRRWA